jgi:hypothetical protein
MLPPADLEQSKNVVPRSLGAASRGAPTGHALRGHAIDEFIGWYCPEPRLSFNRTVVLCHRFFLEQKNPAPRVPPTAMPSLAVLKFLHQTFVRGFRVTD